MKNFISCVAVIVLVFWVSGCFDSGTDRSKRLTFENASHRTVHVISLTHEWQSFSLAPGEKVKLRNIDNPDYRYEPEHLIKEGSASSDRRVIFVDE